MISKVTESVPARRSGFVGSDTLLEKNSKGTVTDSRTLDASTGAIRIHEVHDNDSITKQEFDGKGNITLNQSLQYDAKARLVDVKDFDSKGIEKDHWHTVYNNDDVKTEEWSWDAQGHVRTKSLYDPESKWESFESFDGSGQPTMRWHQQDGRVIDFWDSSDKPNQYGACVGDNKFKDHIRETRCYANSGLISITKETSLGEDFFKTRSVEWSEGSGKLLYAAYYDYDFNSEGDWKHRKIWIVSPEIPEKTLYEEDGRVITYW